MVLIFRSILKKKESIFLLSYTQLKVYEGIHKAAQRSLENILESDGAFKPSEDKINRLIHFSKAADFNLVESELVHS